MSDIFIYDALRTPLGKGNGEGALFEVRPVDLLSKCLRALQQRQGIETHRVEDFLLGCMLPVSGQADNIAKTALLQAGWSAKVPGVQLNRFQTSGLSAILLGAAKVRAGWNNLIIVGGLESRSRIARENNRGAISSDPDIMTQIGSIPAGLAADLLATIEGFTKEQLDEYAFNSIQKAQKAVRENYFEQSITPIYDQNNISILEKDETIPLEILSEDLSNQESVFGKINQGFEAVALTKYPLVERVKALHTLGHIAKPADSAALLLIGNHSIGQELSLKPRAKIIGINTTSTEFTIHHLGGIEAAKICLKRNNLTPNDIDLWYINESYAAPAILFQQTFNIKNADLNACGGNIAYGDASGANGAILCGMLLNDLERRGHKRGLLAMSAEGGMGESLVIERLV